MGAGMGAAIGSGPDRSPRTGREGARTRAMCARGEARQPPGKPVTRPQPAVPRGGAAVAALASRLTDRDRRIALDCYEHRVLATEQLRRLHFRAARTARERLQELRELRVLASFRPTLHPGQGSAQNHWLLDDAGAPVVAAELGLERAELRWQRQAALAIASSSKLTHQLEVNEFFTRLAEEAQTAGGALERWWGERRARAALTGIVSPDGYAQLRLPGARPIELLLELDRGTEDHQRLREKARRYAKALPRTELNAFVLLLVPSAARAERASDTLAAGAVPIVVRVWTPASGGTPLALVREADAHTARRLDPAANW
jgi:hypothetical protein